MSDLSLLGTGSQAALPQDSNGPLLFIGSTIITCVMLVVVLCRFWSRAVILKVMGPDDWTIIPAVALSISMAVLTGISVQNGTGKHIWNIEGSNMKSVFKGIFLGNIHYVLSLAFAKTSMLLQLHRITAPRTKTRLFLIAVFSAAIIFSIVNFFIACFQCTPVSYQWERVDPTAKGYCMSLKVVSYTTSVFHIVTDFAIWIAPMPLIWKLQLPKPQKIALFIVFSLGGIACVASIARFVVVAKLANNAAQLKDSPYHQVPAVLWSVAETNIVIICACLPTIRPLLKTCLPRIFGSMFNTAGTPSGGRSGSKSAGRSGFGTHHTGVNHSHVSSKPGGGGISIALQERGRLPLHSKDYSSSTEELAAEGKNNAVIMRTTDVKVEFYDGVYEIGRAEEGTGGYGGGRR